MTEAAAHMMALLFAAEQPLTVNGLAGISGLDQTDVMAALSELEQDDARGGLRLSHHQDGFRLVTDPRFAPSIRRLLEDQAANELTKPALETLAIIAYRGPIGRSAVEDIRGVGSETTIRGLLSRQLIEVSGRTDEPGRPPAYTVTNRFLDLFGFSHTGQLPPLPEPDHAA